MEFIHDGSHGSVTRRVKIADGPVIPHPGSGTGKRLRVTSASITYVLRGEDWVVDSWSLLNIAGVVLKKDGTEGRETWGGGVHYGWERMPEYAWLTALIDACAPEGAPVLPFRLTGLELDELEQEAGA